MKKIILTILLLSSAYSEHIISYEITGLSPIGNQLTYAYWIDELYFKIGYGGERADQDNAIGTYNYMQ